MIKTNSKAAKEKIRSYILEGFQAYHEGENGSYSGDLVILNNMNTEDFSEVCNAVLRIFFVQMLKYDNRYKAGRATRFDLFKDWICGLCAPVDNAFMLGGSAIGLLGEWLEETEEERSKYTETQAEEMIIKLLWREITGNATRTGVLY